MTSATTPDSAPEAPGPHGDLFRSPPDAETTGQRRPVPDESEAAMVRLRTPFDIETVEVRG
jgi:hypothetical protein